MNPDPAPRPANGRLDRHLDGLLDAAEEQAFARELASDAGLRREAQADAELVKMLRGAYGPPAGKMPDAVGRRTSRVRSFVGIAALLAIGVVAALLLLPQRSEPFAALYRVQQAAGFEPAVVCTDEGEFRRWTRERIGVELSPPDGADAGVRLVGWSYAESPALYTFLLLARVDGRGVVVAMGVGDEPIKAPAATDRVLNVFPQRVGRVWMYEITPLKKPRIVPGIQMVGE